MNKNLISGLFGALLSLGIFGLIYFFVDDFYINKFLPDNKVESVIYFFMLFIAPFFTVAVHELGHLLTGLFLKQKLKLFIVAFLGIKEEDGKLKIFWNKNLTYYGGIAATVPKTENEINPKSFAKILIAGPVFSLLYFILCLFIFLKYDSLFNSFFALSALISFGLFLATTLPEKSGIMFTDRKRFERLMTKGVQQEVEIAMYELITKGIIDNSFRSIDLQKTEILDKDPDSTINFWASYIRYMFYKENGQVEKEIEAMQKLSMFKDKIPKNIWATLKIEL